jgi:hypothetical protein
MDYFDEIDAIETQRDFGDVIKKLDGSYVINLGVNPFNVPQGHPLFLEVEEYATANPDRVTNEQPPTPPTLEEVKAAKKAEIADARWRHETGGVTVNDMTVATDRESQALITGAALQATIDTEYSCQWKTAEGFVTLTAAMILAVAQAVRRHVQDSFDREADLAGQIDAATTAEEAGAVTWSI